MIVRLLFAVIIVFLVYACSDCEDCEQDVVLEPSEIMNSSSFDVLVLFAGEDSVEKKIEKNSVFFFNDSAYSALIPRCDCGLFLDGCGSKPLNVYLKFLSNEPQCIAFEGKKQVTDKDIRFMQSYVKVDEDDYVGITVHLYRYTIDDSIFNMAQSCDGFFSVELD